MKAGEKEAGARLLLTAAIMAVPLLGWAPAWIIESAFFLLLAGSLLLAVRARSPLAIPRAQAASFVLAAALGALHLARGANVYESMSFLLLLLWAALFLALSRSFLPSGAAMPAVAAWAGIELVLIVLLPLRDAGGRTLGTFANANQAAVFFASLLAFALGSLLWGVPGGGSSSRVRRAVLWSMAAASTAGAMLGGSRSAFVMVIALWGLVLAAGKGRRRLAAALVLAALLLIPSRAAHRLAKSGAEDPYAFSRTEIWRSALAMGADHPLLGAGPNLFGWVSPRYIFPVEGANTRFGRIARGPHGDMMRAFAEGGAAGIACVVLFLIPLGAAFPRAVRDGRGGHVLALAVILASMLVHDLTQSTPFVFLILFWSALLLPPSAGPEGPEGMSAGEKGVHAPARKVLAIITLGVVLPAALAQAWDLAARDLWNRGRQAIPRYPQESHRLISRAARQNPIHPGIARDLSSLLAEAPAAASDPALFAGAESALTRAHRLNRLDPVPLHRLADLYAKRAQTPGADRARELAAAADAAARVLALTPHNVFAMRTLARVREAEARPAEALRLLERALLDEPDYLAARRDQARILRDLPGVGPAERERAEAEMAAAAGRVGKKKPAGDYEKMLFSMD
jgi:hypothetical protein